MIKKRYCTLLSLGPFDENTIFSISRCAIVRRIKNKERVRTAAERLDIVPHCMYRTLAASINQVESRWGDRCGSGREE